MIKHGTSTDRGAPYKASTKLGDDIRQKKTAANCEEEAQRKLHKHIKQMTSNKIETSTVLPSEKELRT